MNTGSMGIISSSMEPRNHSLEDICRRGSLPLKKRRFTLPDTSPSDTIRTEDDEKPRASLALLPEQSLSFSAANDEKIAALALVAAASSSFAPQPPVASVSVPNVEHSETHATVQDESAHKAEYLVAFSDTPQSPAAYTPRRAHRPPLASPLPGGCHGRTSRNNSYCRRQPCYNGSKYCKLHYQHYVVAGIRAPMDEDDASSLCQPVLKPPPEEAKTPSSAAHQDKRYSGGKHEMRCSATTTRGRACAYIAVNGTKYCYLHADYDTNPPPRRSAVATKSRTTRESPFRLGKVNLRALESVPSIASDFSAAEVSIASPPSVASETSSRMPSPFNPGAGALSGKTARGLKGRPPNKTSRRTASKLAEMHAESPFPLLSMISTDQWYHKMVKISTGPLVDRVGTVEKWGNGWVSVNISGIGSHNRRSFELYLMDDDEDVKEEGPPNEADEAQHQSNASLLRCVSRDAVSPSPTSTHESGSVSKPVKLHGGSRVTKTKSLVRSAPAVVPETPKPQYARLSLEETPNVPKRTTGVGGADLVPKVTPSTPKKAKSVDDVPLVESLLLAQEGRSKLDLLFGTAALERGRRTIHKPTRYEDKALLAKKRGRKVSLEPDCEAPCKRKRSGL